MSFYREVACCRALVDEAEVRVAKQRSLIARLHRLGANSSISERLLTNYIAALASRREELRAYYEPAKSDRSSTTTIAHTDGRTLR